MAAALRATTTLLVLLSTCVCALALAPHVARANGRMPGASQLKMSAADPARIVVQATFGLLQSFDRGASWSWICEEVVSTVGVAVDPPLTTTGDGTIVLLPPVASTLVSHDRGCSWEHAPAPLAGIRAVDLTVDPGDEARVLVLSSTVSGLNDKGFAEYTNTLVESRDDARTWRLLASLPADIELETIEVAGSDTDRIYVSGTASAEPSLGVILRSEDGGKQWARETLQLPAGRGSLLISAVDPKRADRLWARVPAKGDVNGTLPTSLFLSDDKGATWRQIAATKRGMFGFALSPDGSELSYGGTSDGLFVGPSDGSGFSRVSDLSVTCLRWSAPNELYACLAEPPSKFSVGRSLDKGRTFEPLYRLADTCPQTCGAGSTTAQLCTSPWARVASFVRASGAMCSLPEVADAGASTMSVAPSLARDAGQAGVSGGATLVVDAGAPRDLDAGRAHDAGPTRGGGSGCGLIEKKTWHASWALWLASVLLARRRRGGRRWCAGSATEGERS